MEYGGRVRSLLLCFLLASVARPEGWKGDLFCGEELSGLTWKASWDDRAIVSAMGMRGWDKVDVSLELR